MSGYLSNTGTPYHAFDSAHPESANVFYIYKMKFDRTAGTNQLFLDIFGLANNQAPAVSTTVNLSGTLNIGGPTSMLSGNISEVLIFERAITATEDTTVHNYLSSKYNLP